MWMGLLRSRPCENVVAFDLDRIDREAFHGRWVYDLTGPDIEGRAMEGANHLALVKQPTVQAAVLVGAYAIHRIVTNGVSLFKTNGTRWPYCSGHALSSSW